MTSSGNDDTKKGRPLPEAPMTRSEKDKTQNQAGSESAGLAPAAAKGKERYRDIGPELRRMFNDVVNEPIPDDLMSLIKKLEKQYGDGSESES
jgi:hypothetical protein